MRALVSRYIFFGPLLVTIAGFLGEEIRDPWDPLILECGMDEYGHAICPPPSIQIQPGNYSTRLQNSWNWGA